MAINKNHEFEELDGVKCAIVEKNVDPARAEFLKNLLEFNGYTVVVTPAPPPMAAAPAPAAEADTPAPLPAELPASFHVGVTDVSFNPINAIFGRLLKTKDRKIVTLAYWKQQEAVSQDEVPYFAKK